MKSGCNHINFILCLGALLSPFLSYSQLEISRYVIGSAGNYVEISSGLNVSSTVGETAVTARLGSYDDTHYTEGFQQPDGEPAIPLVLTILIDESQCPDVQDGVIEVYPTGCKEPYSIQLAGNGDTTVVEDIGIEGYVFSDLDSGYYEITVNGETFCTVRRVQRVDLKNDDCNVEIYTGITPNGDGQNDKWIIDNIEINQPNEVTIFSRWGQKVWYATNYNNEDIAWEGEDQDGNILPDGTYFYAFSVEGNESASKSGWIQLTR